MGLVILEKATIIVRRTVLPRPQLHHLEIPVRADAAEHRNAHRVNNVQKVGKIVVNVNLCRGICLVVVIQPLIVRIGKRASRVMDRVQAEKAVGATRGVLMTPIACRDKNAKGERVPEREVWSVTRT